MSSTGRCNIPVALILNLVKDAAIGAGPKAFGLNTSIESLVFENVKFPSTTELKPNTDIKISMSIQLVNGEFEVYEGKTLISSGIIKCGSDPRPIRQIQSLHKAADLPILTSSDVYKEFRLRGYNYVGDFKIKYEYLPRI